jgi:hypothetical protein
MVAMVTLHERRIRFPRLLVHLVVENIAGGVEKGGKSSGGSSHEVVDLNVLQF